MCGLGALFLNMQKYAEVSRNGRYAFNRPSIRDGGKVQNTPVEIPASCQNHIIRFQLPYPQDVNPEIERLSQPTQLLPVIPLPNFHAGWNQRLDNYDIANRTIPH